MTFKSSYIMKYFIYLMLFNVCLAQELGIVVSKSKLKKQPKGFSKVIQFQFL